MRKHLIDVHAHLMYKNGGYDTDKRELYTAVERYGVSRLYVSNPGSYYSTSEEIEGFNAPVRAFCAEDPKRFKYLCYLNPAMPDTIDVLRRAVLDHGAAGIKLWVATLCDDCRVFPVAEACIELNVPILIHAFHKYAGQLPDETTGYNVANLAARYPEARLIMAHLGGDAYHDIKSIRPHKNVWTDISGSKFRAGELEYAAGLVGAKRVLYGTDNIFTTNTGAVEDAALTEDEKQDIFWRNACEIFNDPIEEA